MKLAIFSDTHLGFGQGTEREQESFDNFRQALEICLREKADCILLPGDIFDEAIPTQETWRVTFRVFSEIKNKTGSVKAKRAKGEKLEELSVTHVPVIAIHGTHEFRGKRFANALEVMEKAGFLFYVHAGRVEIEKDAETVVIHGLGGVPEKKALDVLRMFSPVPIPGKRNILVLHQSIKELLPFGDEMIASISFSDLPKGFDLIVNGHFHSHSLQDLGETKFFIPGSTIVTQMKKAESEKPKGVFVLDTKTMSLGFFPLESQRQLFHETLSFQNAMPEEVRQKTFSCLESMLSGNFKLKPLVRVNLKGTLAKGISPADIQLQDIFSRFAGEAIISLDKDFSVQDFARKLEQLRALQKNRKSISAMGLELLEKKLSETGFSKSLDARELLELLQEGKVEEAVKMLSKETA